MFSMVQMIWQICRTLPVGHSEDGDCLKPLFRCCGDMDDDIWQDDVFFGVAEESGMAAIGDLMIPFSGDTFNTYGDRSRSAADVAVGLRTDLSERSFLSYSGESCLQLKARGSLCMFMRHLDASKTTRIQALVSLMMGTATPLFKLVEARVVLAFSRLPGTNPFRADELRRLAVCSVVGCALFVFSLAYAVAKITMSQVCASSLWDITECADV